MLKCKYIIIAMFLFLLLCCNDLYTQVLTLKPTPVDFGYIQPKNRIEKIVNVKNSTAQMLMQNR